MFFFSLEEKSWAFIVLRDCLYAAYTSIPPIYWMCLLCISAAMLASLSLS